MTQGLKPKTKHKDCKQLKNKNNYAISQRMTQGSRGEKAYSYFRLHEAAIRFARVVMRLERIVDQA